MMEGQGHHCQSPYGHRKTCAFGIPLIVGLDAEKKYPQAVVMAPHPGAGAADHRRSAGPRPIFTPKCGWRACTAAPI